MRTSLVYVVDKEEEFNTDTNKWERHITNKSYNFFVTGAKSEEEHNRTIADFREHLQLHNISSDAFSNGSWKDALRYGADGQKDFCIVCINVRDMDDKQYIKELYNQWKLQNIRR